MKLTKTDIITVFRIVTLAIAGWSALIAAMIISSNQTVHLTYPKTPDPETHRIVAYAFKNTVRYITKEQMKTIHWLDWTLIMLAVFIAVNLLINVKWPLPSKNRQDD
jgi:hypothetical protein